MFLLCLYLYYRYPILGFAGGYLPLILGFAGSLGGLVAVIVLGVRKIFRVDLGLIPRSLIGVLIPALGAWFHLYNYAGNGFRGQRFNAAPENCLLHRLWIGCRITAWDLVRKSAQVFETASLG